MDVNATPHSQSICNLNVIAAQSPAHLNAPRAYLPCRTGESRAATKANPMTDLLWFGALAGLVALTLAYVRLCDEA